MGDASNWRNNGCSSTTEGFVSRHGKFSTDLLFNHFIAHVTSQCNDGISSDSRKNGSCQFWRVQDLVLDAEEIRSTDFFDVSAGSSIEIDDLSIALCFGQLTWHHTWGIVANRFDTTRTTRSSSMELIRNQQFNSTHAALEVRSNRCDVNHERITWSRRYAENRTASH